MRPNDSCQEPGPLDDREQISTLADNEILDLLYHTYGNYLYMLVRSKTGSAGLSEEDATDCFGNIIMKLAEHNCKKVRQFRGGSTFKTFLTVVCGNMVIDYVRSENRKKRSTTNIEDTAKFQERSAEVCGAELLTSDPALQLIRNEQAVLMAEAVEIISKELGRLDPKERCIFRFRIEEGKSYREIDEFLGIDNSKYLFSKIINKLRSSIDSPLRKKIEELLVEI